MDFLQAKIDNDDNIKLRESITIKSLNPDQSSMDGATPVSVRKEDEVRADDIDEDTNSASSNSENTNKGGGTTLCCVCNDKYIGLPNTSMLPCLHTICFKCTKTDETFQVEHQSSNNLAGSTYKAHTLDLLMSEGANCPVCRAAVERIENGLSPKYPTTNIENLTNTADQSSAYTAVFEKSIATNSKKCGFCSEEENAPAVYSCADCSESMCRLCYASHKRQKKTKNHKLTRTSFNSHDMLNTLNETCQEAQDYEMFGVSELHTILKEAKHCMKNLKILANSVPQAKDAIHNTAKDAESEICEFVYDFTQALERHKEILLNQIQQIKSDKEKRLELREQYLCRLHSDLENSCNIVGDMLSFGTTQDVADVQDTVVEKLNKLLDFSKLACQPLDTTIKFSPESRGDVLGNFQMYGKVIDSVVCPGKCRLSASDIESVRVGQASTVTLETRDAEGRPFKHAAKVDAWITTGTDNRNRKGVTVKKQRSGVYELTLESKFHGPHFLHVLVDGQLINGQPYKFTVRPGLREHSGVWQLGLAGRRDTSYFGHSGTPHWSCCGKTNKPSECFLLPGSSDNFSVREVTL